MSEKVGPVNLVNHTSWVAVVTPTDRPKSVRNCCFIELFCGVVCVVTLPFWHFCWCRGFCHRSGSDILLFVLIRGLQLLTTIQSRRRGADLNMIPKELLGKKLQIQSEGCDPFQFACFSMHFLSFFSAVTIFFFFSEDRRPQWRKSYYLLCVIVRVNDWRYPRHWTSSVPNCHLAVQF